MAKHPQRPRSTGQDDYPDGETRRAPQRLSDVLDSAYRDPVLWVARCLAAVKGREFRK